MKSDDPRPRDERDSQQVREELADEYALLARMNPRDEVIADLVAELRVKLAAKIAEVGIAL